MESGILSSGALLQRQEVRKSRRPGKIKFEDDQDWVDNGVSIGHGVRGTERRQQRFTDSQLVLERDGAANPGAPWGRVAGHQWPCEARPYWVHHRKESQGTPMLGSFHITDPRD